MTRIKRGYIIRRRRPKMRLFSSSCRGGHSRLTRTITQQNLMNKLKTRKGTNRFCMKQ